MRGLKYILEVAKLHMQKPRSQIDYGALHVFWLLLNFNLVNDTHY